MLVPDDSKLCVGVGSSSKITENGLAVEYRRAGVLEVDVYMPAPARIAETGIVTLPCMTRAPI